MEESFERDRELARESRQLPATTYNLTRTLLARSKNGCVFVPIRSMQYMAVIDAEEIVFVDSQHKRWIEIAWQNFRPQTRDSLEDAVTFDAVYYTPAAKETMRRLQGDFLVALKSLAARDRTGEAAPVLRFPTSPNRAAVGGAHPTTTTIGFPGHNRVARPGAPFSWQARIRSGGWCPPCGRGGVGDVR
jgi:hypothetical protein